MGKGNKGSPQRNSNNSSNKNDVVEVREFRNGYYEQSKVVEKANFDLGRELVPFFLEDGTTARLESGRGVKTNDGNIIAEAEVNNKKAVDKKPVAKITGLLTPGDFLKPCAVTPVKSKPVEAKAPVVKEQVNEPVRPSTPPTKDSKKKEHSVVKKNKKEVKKVRKVKESPELSAAAPVEEVSAPQKKFAAPSFQASPPPSQLPAPRFLMKPQNADATNHLRGLLGMA